MVVAKKKKKKWGTILIFGAAGLVAAHFIRKKLED